MKKNGFTLIELLAVITILAIISLVTVPIVTTTINKSKEGVYDRQVEQIKKASQSWFLRQKDNLTSVDEKIIVDLQTLLDDGYLEKSKITNTKSGEDMTGCVVITYSSNQYQYNFTEENCSCSDSKCTKY